MVSLEINAPNLDLYVHDDPHRVLKVKQVIEHHGQF